MRSIDWRAPEHRREAFAAFYGFHLRHRSHPGCVYSLLPALAGDDDPERRAWVAFLNGNTQNPVTTSLLLEAAPTVDHAAAAAELWSSRYADLAWDTDRRYHKAAFPAALNSYAEALGGRRQAEWWAEPDTWEALWGRLSSLSTFGRLSTWSYAEFGRLLGLHDHDATTLMLGDQGGSRSHRNGLAILTGNDHLDDRNKANLTYPAGLLDEWEALADDLLAEQDHPDAGRLTLESALCTFKSWHRPRRRYPNVYADMAYDRLRWAEERWGPRFEWAWQARRRDLPAALRLEDNPHDPGCVPVKQDWYRLTGEVIMLDHDDPRFRNGFADLVRTGWWGERP